MNNIYCPNCGQRNDPHNRMCKHCGMKIFLIPQYKNFYCPSCGASNQQGSQYCLHCEFEFSKIENLSPGVKGQKIVGEVVDKSQKSFFMQKSVYVILGFILIAFWAYSLFMKWFDYSNLNLMYHGNILDFSKYISSLPVKNFFLQVQLIWLYLPFVAIILSIISLIRGRIYSLVTYCSFALPWIIGFFILSFYNKLTTITFQSVLQVGEICFVIFILLAFGYDKLIHLLNISEN